MVSQSYPLLVQEMNYPCMLSVLCAAVQILQVGPDDLEHPLNKKVRLQVYLRDLQEEAGLTEDALQHIALVCGPRCAADMLCSLRCTR